MQEHQTSPVLIDYLVKTALKNRRQWERENPGIRCDPDSIREALLKADRKKVVDLVHRLRAGEICNFGLGLSGDLVEEPTPTKGVYYER